MPKREEYSEAFWLGYCDAVKASWNPSSGSAMFFGQQGQLGPAAGPGIDERYTNAGIYQLADNLLRSDSLSYNPAQSNSYSRELLKFVDNVDMGSSPNESHNAALDDMRQNQDPARMMLEQQKSKALRRYQRDLDMGMMQPGLSFEQWAEMNDPAYAMALRQSQAGSAAFGQVQREISNPRSEEYNRVRETLTTAVNADRPQAGLTMPAAAQSASAAAAVVKAQQAGESIPQPPGTRTVTAYSAPDYSNTIRDLIPVKGSPENAKWETQTIDFNKGNNVQTSSFGQSSIRGTAPSSIPTPWFGLSSPSGQRDGIEFALNSEDQEKTDIKVKWTDRRLINVSPGNWDIKGKDFKLKSSAPDSSKSLMRPTQLVCLSNLSYDIKFQGDSVREVDQIISKANRGEAGLHIFGWRVGVESRDSAISDPTHVAKWDKESGLLTVLPKLYGASVCVAAIVGEKVDVSG